MIVLLVLIALAVVVTKIRYNAVTKHASPLQPGIAADLMAQADACVGHDPHEAYALRSAARDYLSAATQR